MNHDVLISQAMRLARLGRGCVEPNPMVGCLIVKNGQIIGQGYHQKFGEPHAEPNALSDCVARGHSTVGATAYVTLEPCCHVNKKTPPCVPRLIDARLQRVVVGCLDPNPAVNGQGVAQLRAAGIEVTTGVLELQCQQLIAAFIASTTLLRPYVTLKWAQTADGKIAGPGGKPLAISNPTAARWVHQMRKRAGAILVGINTILMDDPLLTARDVTTPPMNSPPPPALPQVNEKESQVALAPSPHQPMRFVLDRDLRTPPHARVVTDPSAPTTIFHGPKTAPANMPGVRLIAIPLGADHLLDLPTALRHIRGMGCTELLVEPGPTLAKSFLQTNLGDRLWIIRSHRPAPAGDCPPAAPVPPWPITHTRDLNGDHLTEYLNPTSPAYFAPIPSPDMD